MRFLHIIWDGAGNVPPQLALVERLLADGHDVSTVSDPQLAERFEAVGARHISASCDPRPTGLTGEQEMFDTFSRFVFGRTWADDLARGVDVVRPDRLLVDGMLWGAMAAAESVNLPTAVLWHSLFTTMVESPFSDLFQAHFGDHHAETRRGLGLPSHDHVAEQLTTADWLLAMTYAELDRPATGSWPNLHYVGAPVPTSTEADVILPPGDDPLVVIAFSTSDMGQRDLVQRIVDELAGQAVRVLVTCGPALPPDALRLPGNAVAATFVPHDDVLPDADLLVTHVGHGTLATGVRNGVPILACPMGRDQHINATVVEKLGIGAVATPDAEPGAFAEHARRLLVDDSVAAASAGLAREVRGHPGLDRAVELVTGPIG